MIDESIIDADARSHSVASCNVRYSDKLGVMFLARRSMPMRCASRVSVLHNKAWRSTSISSPRARRAFEILGQNTGGAEPADQLPARFRTQFGAALVDQDGGSDIAKTSSDSEPTISVGQGLRAIRQLVAGIILPPRYPAANRPLLRARIRPSTPEPPFCRVVSGSSIIGDYAPEPPSSQALVGLSRRHTRHGVQSPPKPRPPAGKWWQD